MQSRHAALLRRSFLVGATYSLISGEAVAQRTDPCASYYGRGYCTDYVNQRTGVRTRGDASTWPANIRRVDIRVGDVAIFRRQNHVAYIEEITERANRAPYARGFPLRFRISEWNYGARDPSTPRECYVTVNFGRSTTREGAFDSAEFMRPGRR